MGTRRSPPLRGALLALVALLGGCAHVTVEKAAPPAIEEAGQASAVGPADVSPRTLQTLRRLDLDALYQQNPAAAAVRLQALAVQSPQPDLLFALAEISYQLGRQAEKKEPAEACAFYYLCAGYAQHYLFDGDSEPGGDNPYDPRFRLACDLYNAGLAKCVRAAQKAGPLQPGRPLNLHTPDGKAFTLEVDYHDIPWPAEQLGPLVFCEDFSVVGLANQYRTYGLGVPLIGTRVASTPAPGHVLYPHDVSFPVTAFFRFEGSVAELSERRSGRLDLYNPLTTRAVTVRGRPVPLESDLTTPLAYCLSHSDLEGVQLAGFLQADKLQKRSGVYMVEPYQPGKIPVLMVHGLLSSPLTWAPMFNDLRADPELRKHFQFWFYLYPTGNPYFVTAADLREELCWLRRELDPQHRDAALDHMVFVGHSMGGLVSHLLTVDSGDDFWRLVSPEPFEQIKGSSADRDELHRMFFFERQPFVERVVFLGTPHHGSKLSPSPATRLVERFVHTPSDLMMAVRDLEQENPKAQIVLRADRLPTSVDLLAPGAPALELLAAKPRAGRVHYHSIIGDAPSGSSLRTIGYVLGEHAERSDGVVPYSSAHLDGVDSELVVAADHTHVHQHPLAVLEVRRILLQHLKDVAADAVVPAAASAPVPGK